MRVLIDGNNNVIVTEEVDIACPFLNSTIIDAAITLRSICERCKEIGVEKVHPLCSLLVGTFKVVLQKTHIEPDEVVV